jgi:hypothetical protein
MIARGTEGGFGSFTFAQLRAAHLMRDGVAFEELKDYCLKPTVERSLKRALKGLVDRGHVLIVGGQGGS